MKELINQHSQPIALESGVVLAAAGTEGSVRHVESISEGDRRRYASRGLIAVRDVEFESSADRGPQTAAAPAVDGRSSSVAETKKEKS